jgi:TP901 family phage tail tape measure protein
MQLRQTNTLLDRMGETLSNTIKWGISSSLMNQFVGSIQQAYGYVQHLDTSLNDIRIVTGKSADEMDRFAENANKVAKSLGSSTTDYTEAALIYYQQGLSDDEAQARAETTLKAANVTGQTGKQVSEELTAVWNGYKVTAEETELYVDKLAAVAATTASDLEELSTGMSKVASAANNMGVDVDQLNAQLATIISVTRQAPETAGTALKTIYARMEDLKIGGEDESGVKLGDVSSTLNEVGISVMDTEGNLRDLGEVIEEVAAHWEDWTNAQQSAIAQALAGKRQYNNLLALFDNWDMYESSLETSRNAVGTLQEQQDIYMESTAAHLQQLKTQWEDFYDSLINSSDVNSVLDGVTNIINVFTRFLDGIGGGKNALLMLGSTAMNVFDKQIAAGITHVIQSFSMMRNNAKQNGCF